MVKNLVFVVVLFFISYYSLYSQTVLARAFADKTYYEVGDHVNYTIELLYNNDLRIFKPALNEYTKDIELIKSDEPVVEDAQGKKKITYRYILSKYDSADVIIPPIPVLYQMGSDTTSLTVTTNPVQFKFRTLQVNTSAEIKDIKPPISIPLALLTILLILIAILLIILLALYFYRKNKRKKQQQTETAPVYFIPAHVKALTELRELDEKKLWQQGLIKEYHSNITEIIRRYFENRFRILALESSTSEIMEQLTRVVLPENIYKVVNDFLNNADLVKFAKYKPIPVVNEEMMRQAVDIVENTVPVQLNISNKEKVNV